MENDIDPWKLDPKTVESFKMPEVTVLTGRLRNGKHFVKVTCGDIEVNSNGNEYTQTLASALGKAFRQHFDKSYEGGQKRQRPYSIR